MRTNTAEPAKAKKKQYTLTESDVDLVEQLRFRYQKVAIGRSTSPVDITKSEIIRAGLLALRRMLDKQFYETVEGVEELKEGRRPKT